MRGVAIIAATLALAACSGEPAGDDAGTEGEEAVATTANGTPPGVYSVASADGIASIVTLNADGTYSQVTPEGTDAASGTFSVVDGQTCFRVRVAGAEPLCYTESAPGEDGSYTATTDDGLELTVSPMPAEEEAAAEGEDAGEEEAEAIE